MFYNVFDIVIDFNVIIFSCISVCGWCNNWYCDFV